jgi:peptidoglycan/xylan/chitin deacetylase (PgdA/CDA1 family)
MDNAEQKEEIDYSKRRLEQELDRSIHHFCYPNGLNSDFNDDTIRIVASLGFETAVTTESGMNYKTAHPFRLRRLSVDPSMPYDYFQRLLAGASRH